MDSGTVTYIPSFIQIGSGIQRLMEGDTYLPKQGKLDKNTIL
jgi:hypothetical protein